MSNRRSIFFPAADVERFRHLSHDRNPLHTDVLYARKTVFAEPVVYGMLTFLQCLRAWRNEGDPLQILGAEGVFRKPVFADRAYELEINESGNEVSLDLFSGDSLQATFTVQFLATKSGNEKEPTVIPVVAPTALSFDQPVGGTQAYGVDTGDRSRALWESWRRILPSEQIQLFAWSSYFVGMHFPGERALFSGFRFDFSAGHPPARLNVTELKYAFDEDLALHTITGRAGGAALELSAFARPASVEATSASVSRFVREKRFVGKRAFITGGGRGFGANLALAFALEGADVTFTYHSDRVSAENIVTEIRALGRAAKAISRDESLDCVPFDFVVGNASGPIRSRSFSEQGSAEVGAFVENTLRLFGDPLASLLPKLAPGACITYISSSFVKEAPPGFTHYAAAKSAVEALVRGLAGEYPSLKFSIFRPRKMLTDQTNTIVKTESTLDPAQVAVALLDRLSEFNGQGAENFAQWDY